MEGSSAWVDITPLPEVSNVNVLVPVEGSGEHYLFAAQHLNGLSLQQ